MNDTAEKLEENIQDSAEVVENDENFDIESVDDTPEEDRVPKRKETSETDTDADNDDEIKNYSEGVQKRISKLKYEFHEERRAKEEAKRLQIQGKRWDARTAAMVHTDAGQRTQATGKRPECFKYKENKRIRMAYKL